MKSRLLIIGAGGHGLVVADAAIEQGIWSEIAFLDDRVTEHPLIPYCPVLGVTNDAHKFVEQYQDLVVAVGDNKRRLQVIDECMNKGFNLPIISHPTATISSYAEIGSGTFLAAHSVVNVGAKLGRGCIINTSATVDHDNLLSDAVHVSPGAHLGGGVQVGKFTWIGIGASVREQVTIGDNVIVGAGAAVVENIEDNLQVLGVPARPKGI